MIIITHPGLASNASAAPPTTTATEILCCNKYEHESREQSTIPIPIRTSRQRGTAKLEETVRTLIICVYDDHITHHTSHITSHDMT